MVESGAQQATEADVLGAIEFGHDCCKKIAAGIRELMAKVRQEEEGVHVSPAINQELLRSDRRADPHGTQDALNTKKYEKLESYGRVDAGKKKAIESLSRRAEGRRRQAVRRY